MKNKTSQTLFSYWNEIRGPRMAPCRFEIEPARIAGILAQTFILERGDDHTFRFRLAGTCICEDFGREFRGKNFLALWSAEDAISFEHVLRTIVLEGAVGVAAIDAATPDGKSALFEIVALPLVHTGNSVNRILGSISLSETRPGWLGNEPLVRQEIRNIDMIWPDGRPYAILERTKSQPPFSALPEPKRIVSSNRRSFRVFDGGRSETAGRSAQPARDPDSRT